MKTPIVFLLTLVALFFCRTAFGGCTAPEGETQAPCASCGNLEQNVKRAHDLAWNELLRNRTMQLELRLSGATLVHLIDPPHSSPGVLYYTVVIEDPQFEVNNLESHAEAVQMMESLGVGISYGHAGMRGEWAWRRAMTTRIENVLSVSVSTGSAPYTMRLFDSKGNPVAGGTTQQPRLTPRQDPALAGQRDLHPDHRYANEACVSEDPRHQQENDSSSYTDSSGGGDWSDSADHWEGWGNGYGDLRPACRPDFSDPAGAGVICII